jgi:hypothetical protein
MSRSDIEGRLHSDAASQAWQLFLVPPEVHAPYGTPLSASTTHSMRFIP